MRVLLYDPYSSGHHDVYLKQVAAEIADQVDVVAVAAEEVDLSALSGQVVATVTREQTADRWASAKVFASAVRSAKADAAIHLFADKDLPALALRHRFSVPTTLLIFRPRSHYPREFSSPLTRRESLVGHAIGGSLRIWMQTSKSHRALTLDEYAAAGWSDRYGDRAGWWPEPPPFKAPAREPADDDGGRVLLFGSIAARKGVAQLVNALACSERAKSITFAGKVNASFRAEFESAVAALEGTAVSVNVVDRWISDEEAAGMLADANLVALSYPRHFGMSRVLLEAAAAGTPVVGNRFGLMAKQIEEYGLGKAVDIEDPKVFGQAIDDVLGRGKGDFAAALEQFARRYSSEAYRSTLARIWSPQLSG